MLYIDYRLSVGLYVLSGFNVTRRLEKYMLAFVVTKTHTILSMKINLDFKNLLYVHYGNSNLNFNQISEFSQFCAIASWFIIQKLIDETKL